MRYGYCRCVDFNILEDIRTQTDRYVSLGVKPENIYFEYHSFELQLDVQIFELFKKVEKGDTIVAPEMNRIARTINQFFIFLNLCLEHKVKIEIDNFKMDFDNISSDTRTLIKMMISVKSNILSQSTKQALENLKRKKKRIGRKPIVYSRIPDRFKTLYPLLKAGAITQREVGERTGFSITTVARYYKIILEYEKKKGEK